MVAQVTVPPHPSPIEPHSPVGHEVFGVQLEPQAPGVPPPPQVAGAVQVVEQVMVPPQPSLIWPHTPAGHAVFGMQIDASDVGGVPHASGVPPPPHVWGAVHGLQLAVRLPQPSDCWPHMPG